MEKSEMAERWSLRGEYMESCNCDYLCPCIYTNPQGPVTYDHCTAVMVFRIDEGNFCETTLVVLKFALTWIWWARAITGTTPHSLGRHRPARCVGYLAS